MRIAQLKKLKLDVGTNFEVIAIFESKVEYVRNHASRHLAIFPILADHTREYYDVSFRRPVLISNPILLSARFKSIGEKKIVVECELISDSKVCVTANVIAVRVPDEWMS